MEIGGYLKYKPLGEYHAYNPDVVNTLQAAINSGDYTKYRRYADVVNNRPPAMLRDLLRLKTESVTPVAIEQVEAAENLLILLLCLSAHLVQKRMKRWQLP